MQIQTIQLITQQTVFLYKLHNVCLKKAYISWAFFTSLFILRMTAYPHATCKIAHSLKAVIADQPIQPTWLPLSLLT